MSKQGCFHRPFYVTTLFLLTFTISCSHKTINGKDYPASWWEPVDVSNKKSWEILPQEAQPGEVIVSKRNELGILSNFAHTPFVFKGVKYQSVEGFWQMMKYPEGAKDPRTEFIGAEWPHKRAEVAQMIGFEAKRAGKAASKIMEKMGINWVTFEEKKIVYRTPKRTEHYKIIREAMLAKLQQNKKVKEVLLATGDLILKPDHLQKPTAPPAWRYCEIWMEIRDSLKKSDI